MNKTVWHKDVDNIVYIGIDHPIAHCHTLIRIGIDSDKRDT